MHVSRARVGRVIRLGRERHQIVGLGWADMFDVQGNPTMVKVATVLAGREALPQEVAA